jgi:hypothetical protein
MAMKRKQSGLSSEQKGQIIGLLPVVAPAAQSSSSKKAAMVTSTGVNASTPSISNSSSAGASEEGGLAKSPREAALEALRAREVAREKQREQERSGSSNNSSSSTNSKSNNGGSSIEEAAAAASLVNYSLLLSTSNVVVGSLLLQRAVRHSIPTLTSKNLMDFFAREKASPAALSMLFLSGQIALSAGFMWSYFNRSPLRRGKL